MEYLSAKREDVLVSGYKRTLDIHQTTLAIKLGKIFLSLDDWMKKKQKEVGRDQFNQGRARRLAEAEWWRNTVAETRRMVEEEQSAEFWLKMRLP